MRLLANLRPRDELSLDHHREPASPCEITWDAIVRERPALAAALYTAQHVSSARDRDFCAHVIWYSVLKPIVVSNVGWDHMPECHGHIQHTGDFLNGVEAEHDAECLAEIARQAWLTTTRAYDVAYQTLYDAMPDCRHRGFCYG